jgi:phenylacetate-coenzyme A ligase PaaK-like adenylate-forming protein
MSFFKTVDQFLVGRVAFPASNYLLNRKNILGRYRKLLLSKHYSKEALRELQFQKLSAVLRQAYRFNPFYTKRFMEFGLEPEDINSLVEVRRIPPLVRQNVIDHRLDMVDTR